MLHTSHMTIDAKLYSICREVVMQPSLLSFRCLPLSPLSSLLPACEGRERDPTLWVQVDLDVGVSRLSDRVIVKRFASDDLARRRLGRSARRVRAQARAVYDRLVAP